MDDKKNIPEQQNGERGGFIKAAVLFVGFLALAVGYYLTIDYVLMVFAQNLPFPYKG